MKTDYELGYEQAQYDIREFGIHTALLFLEHVVPGMTNQKDWAFGYFMAVGQATGGLDGKDYRRG